MTIPALPPFPQRKLVSIASHETDALQIIKRVAQKGNALDVSEEDTWTDDSKGPSEEQDPDARRALLKERTGALQLRVQAISFNSVEELGTANELLSMVLLLKDDIARYHEPIKRPLKEAHAQACKTEHDDLDPVVLLEKQLKLSIATLDLKLRRMEAETANARQQAAAEAGSAMQQQMIEAARESGASDDVLASLGAMQMLVPIAAETESFVRPKGYSTRDQFEVAVTDVVLLAKTVIAGGVQKEVLQGNLKLLAAMAKASNGDLDIPGVRITKKVSVTGRRSR